ncbi:MAG TPA: DUF4394 domain-containing protein [Casimicrobiaceae bacterium]|nr:DUF4394 domain-containing protein [Casimicrobiaceae bacterium]
MNASRTNAWPAFCSALAFAAATQGAHAELIYGLTNSSSTTGAANTLISFDSATPGSVNVIGAVTGVAAGDRLIGIDIRPSTGPNNNRLYALGVNAAGQGRVYTINTLTGLALSGAILAADPADITAPTPYQNVLGTSFGFDFNPVVDRLRVTSDTGQNLRINVDNGLVQLDVPLAYTDGTTSSPVIVGAAYNDNAPGATTTALRGVDIGRSPDFVVLFTNANAGTFNSALGTSFDSGPLFGYDFSGLTGIPYFSVTAPGANVSQLYANFGSGITLVGTIGGGNALVGIAAQIGKVPEPASLGLVGIALVAMLVIVRRRERRIQ